LRWRGLSYCYSKPFTSQWAEYEFTGKKERSDQIINSIKKTVRVLMSKYFSKQYFRIVTAQ